MGYGLINLGHISEKEVNTHEEAEITDFLGVLDNSLYIRGAVCSGRVVKFRGYPEFPDIIDQSWGNTVHIGYIASPGIIRAC